MRRSQSAAAAKYRGRRAVCAAILVACLPAPCAGAATTQTFTSVADAYVSQGNPSANYGSKSKLKAKQASPEQKAYLRFDVKGLSDPVTQATLRLYATSGSATGFDVRDVSDDEWGEKAITYSNAPSTGQTVGSSGQFKSGKWVSVDVTSSVNGNGDVNFALTGSGSNTITLASREYGAKFAPQLVVQAGSSGPCATKASPPSTWEHVVWIVMENHSYSEIIGSSSAPYINGLAGQCGLATNYSAVTHPSLPNYIAMTSGSTQGISDSDPPSSHPLAVASIFSQLGAGGWRSLEESMPSNCYPTSTGDYKVTHNPATYYTGIASDCATYDVPLTATPDISAKFTLVTPNKCNDMHDCSITTGDDWLKGFIPKLIASPQYQAGSTAIFVVFDEDDNNEDNHIPALVISPSTPAGTRSDTSFSHYSLLRTTEEMLGLDSFLGGAASASSMKSAFHL